MTSNFPATPIPHRPASSRRARQLLRVTMVAALAAGVTVLGTGAAQAHVHVLADSTASGSFSALTFRIPNESESATTTAVAVQLPQDTPFLEVSTKVVTGWTVAVREAPLPKPVQFEGTTITKAVRTVTWTAERGSAIAPGQYQEFSISVGPLPAPGAVLLPTTQTYSDGKIVKWDEPTPASGEEPESPAPVLMVTAAVPEGAASEAPAATPALSTPEATAAAPATTAKADVPARVLGGAGLLLGLVALAVAGLGWRRNSTAGRPA